MTTGFKSKPQHSVRRVSNNPKRRSKGGKTVPLATAVDMKRWRTFAHGFVSWWEAVELPKRLVNRVILGELGTAYQAAVAPRNRDHRIAMALLQCGSDYKHLVDRTLAAVEKEVPSSMLTPELYFAVCQALLDTVEGCGELLRRQPIHLGIFSDVLYPETKLLLAERNQWPVELQADSNSYREWLKEVGLAAEPKKPRSRK